MSGPSAQADGPFPLLPITWAAPMVRLQETDSGYPGPDKGLPRILVRPFESENKHSDRRGR
jgi:hypothetical protein